MSKFVLSAFSDEIDESLKTQMDVLDRYGVKYIEMRGVNGRGIIQHTAGEAREIKKQLDGRGFGISALGSPIGKIMITEDFGPHLELFRHAIELAGILGTPYIRMFSFFIPKGEKPEKYREQVMDRLQKFVDIVKGTGITLLHENEKDIYGDIPERCLDIHESVKDPCLKAAFDPANYVQCDAVTYPGGFRLLKKHIIHMHIKDALFKDHSVVPAGYGDGHVKEILAELHKDGYEGFLTIEPHLATFTGFAELEPGAKPKSGEKGGALQFSTAFLALKELLDGLAR